VLGAPPGYRKYIRGALPFFPTRVKIISFHWYHPARARKLQTANCKLQTANLDLPFAICHLPFAICYLQFE